MVARILSDGGKPLKKEGRKRSYFSKEKRRFKKILEFSWRSEVVAYRRCDVFQKLSVYYFFFLKKLEYSRVCIICINYKIFMVFVTIVFRNLIYQVGRSI